MMSPDGLNGKREECVSERVEIRHYKLVKIALSILTSFTSDSTHPGNWPSEGNSVLTLKGLPSLQFSYTFCWFKQVSQATKQNQKHLDSQSVGEKQCWEMAFILKFSNDFTLSFLSSV